MLKFLRRYNKWILAVFGTLLLLVFLVPTAATEITRRYAAAGAKWATLKDGTTLPESERSKMAGQLEVLTNSPEFRQIDGILGIGRSPEHWYLLTHEAELAGLTGGAEEGRRFIQQMVAADPNGSEAAALAMLLHNTHATPTTAMEALANVRGVHRMLNIANNAPLSDSRAKWLAASTMLRAQCDTLVLDARNPLPGKETPAPTGDQLKKQFDGFSEKPLGEGDHGFGYRIPDRVKLEWFKVSADDVRKSLDKDPRLSGVELRKAYIKDPGKFGPPGADGKYPEFDTVEPAVRQKMLDQITVERLSEIERWVSDQLALALRGVARSGGYYDLTPEQAAKQPTFNSLVQQLSQQFALPVPEYKADAESWHTPKEIDSIQGLGTSTTTRFGTQPRRVSDLVTVLREFGGSPTVLVQKGVAGPGLHSLGAMGTATDLWFFRVIDAEANHPPKSLEEVADAVKTDLDRLVRYDDLVKMIPELEAKAVAPDGFGQIADQFGVSTGFVAVTQYNFGRPIQIPSLGSDPGAVEEIIARAMKLPMTTPLTDVPLKDRVFVIPVPQKLAILIVRVASVQPLSQESYENYAKTGFLMQVLQSKLDPPNLRAIYGFEPLKKRYDFKAVRAANSSNSGSNSTPGDADSD